MSINSSSRYCDPCRFRDKKVAAFYFCQNCMEYYCKRCRKQHLKFRVTMGHLVVDERHKNNETVGKCTVQDFCQENKLDRYSTEKVASNSECYDYEADILETDAARHSHLTGKCIVRVDSCSISLTEVANHVTLCWPYTCIRKYGSMDSKIFFFESGRRCGAGEGRYVLMTNHATILHKSMTNFIRCIEKSTTI